LAIEIIGAVYMPGISQVVVVLGGAGGTEAVVAAAGVSNNFDQVYEILGIKLVQNSR
jgi:hypothetical protein